MVFGLKEGAFKERGIKLEWVDYPGGTGAMAQALRKGEIDIATILTEGIITDILNGNPSKILQFYVKSSLKWGIHVAPNSPFQKVEDLRGTRSAISRYGSGSHLMNYVLANNLKWAEKELRFEEIKDLNGAVDALSNNKADYFLWERFTTKPLVDKGVFRWLDNCPTPWPCFVIAATNEILNKDKGLVKDVLEVVGRYSANIKSRDGIELEIANRYGQKLDDIVEWMGGTEWETKPHADDMEKIEYVASYLERVGVIQNLNHSELGSILEPLSLSK